MKKLAIAIGVLIIVFIFVQNNCLTTSYYEIENQKIPPNFNNYKIVHLSDLHNKMFGKNQKNLVKQIEKLDPDLLVLTGDLIGFRKANFQATLDIVEQLDVPVIMVSGNNDWATRKWGEFKQELTKKGVIILDNKQKFITIENQSIVITGVEDPCGSGYEFQEPPEGYFNLLLVHRPDIIEEHPFIYDLSLAGHTHGGQIRIPFVGGLYAPGQGWFPKYDSGQVFLNRNSVIINRGLGNNGFPARVFNRPEIGLITLKTVCK